MAISDDSAITQVETLRPDSYLSERERSAYDFVVKHRQPGLSPTLQAKLFSLFLQGTDTVEIARLNPGINLGQIVVCRVEGRWDEKRQEHIEALLRETRLRLQQTTLEGVDFISMQLAAAHKLHGDKLKKYLQSGEADDLGPFSIHGFRAYKEAVDILKSLTGQDKKEQRVSGEIVHKHETVPAVNRAMTTEEARAVIKDALGKK